MAKGQKIFMEGLSFELEKLCYAILRHHQASIKIVLQHGSALNGQIGPHSYHKAGGYAALVSTSLANAGIKNMHLTSSDGGSFVVVTPQAATDFNIQASAPSSHVAAFLELENLLFPMTKFENDEAMRWKAAATGGPVIHDVYIPRF